ncbi:MAG: hypothetical protein K2G63_00970 [Oscillospiraceae bacterium]|nr:hypothetical protein [Oscillospiraceae bacterium]
MVSKLTKKISSAVVASVLAVSSLSALSAVFAVDGGNKAEFENGVITGTATKVETEEKGFSGDGYVYLRDAGDTISVDVEVPETGMYELMVCYNLPTASGSKTQNFYINDAPQGQIVFSPNDEFAEASIGKFKLTKGVNTLKIESSWGWTMFDYIVAKTAELPALVGSNKLSDPKATKETQSLMNFLADSYGKHVISGQQEIYKYGPHDFEYEFEYIKEKTGVYPAIRGFDYLNACNPLYGSDDGTTERMIDWVKNKNGIITSSWHITVPVNFANYNIGDKIDWSQATYGVWADDHKTIPATDFDTSKAIVEGTKEYEYFMLCLDVLASEIQKLQDENIPLIFRPLHEAEGGGGENGSWFWWGQDGSAVYKDLWRLMYKTLTEKYGLHNIIWEWNSYAFDTSRDWYPGDEYVDLVAYDKYNCTDWSTGQPVLTHNDSAISSTFYALVEKYEGKKMVAMAENDSIPTLQNILDEKAGWLYFCPWYDGGSPSTNFLSDPMFNTVEDLKTMYTSDYCISLDELPENLYSYESQSKPDPTQATTEVPKTTEAIQTTVTTMSVSKGLWGDANNDGTVDVADVVAVAAYVGNPEANRIMQPGLLNSDVHATGNGITADDALAIQQYLAKIVTELPVKS